MEDSDSKMEEQKINPLEEIKPIKIEERKKILEKISINIFYICS